MKRASLAGLTSHLKNQIPARGFVTRSFKTNCRARVPLFLLTVQQVGDAKPVEDIYAPWSRLEMTIAEGNVGNGCSWSLVIRELEASFAAAGFYYGPDFQGLTGLAVEC